MNFLRQGLSLWSDRPRHTYIHSQSKLHTTSLRGWSKTGHDRDDRPSVENSTSRQPMRYDLIGPLYGFTTLTICRSISDVCSVDSTRHVATLTHRPKSENPEVERPLMALQWLQPYRATLNGSYQSYTVSDILWAYITWHWQAGNHPTTVIITVVACLVRQTHSAVDRTTTSTVRFCQVAAIIRFVTITL